MEKQGPRVLLVDDEESIQQTLSVVLPTAGYTVYQVRNGNEALQRVQSVRPDLILLDLGLPDMDGKDVIRDLREWAIAPIIVISVRHEEYEKVDSLDTGAHDYLTKPFSIDILLARLRAVSRRGAIARPVCLEIADVRLDPASHRVTRGDEVLALTPREYRLLELLMRNPGRAISRDTILESVWGFGSGINENTLEVFMRLLRGKVDTREPKLIHTVRGFGYMMREPA